jgi:hypothetical protein
MIVTFVLILLCNSCNRKVKVNVHRRLRQEIARLFLCLVIMISMLLSIPSWGTTNYVFGMGLVVWAGAALAF